MSKRLRPGNVVTIRVNPKDAMGVIDVVNAANLNMKGMSFSSIVSLALSSLIQTVKDQGVIPERSGFEYLDMVKPYIGKQNGRKLEVNKAIQQLGSRVHISGISRPVEEEEEHEVEELSAAEPARPSAPTTVEPSAEVTLEQRRAGRRLTELLQKRDMAEGGMEGILWGADDQREYDEVYRIVYPEG